MAENSLAAVLAKDLRKTRRKVEDGATIRFDYRYRNGAVYSESRTYTYAAVYVAANDTWYLTGALTVREDRRNVRTLKHDEMMAVLASSQCDSVEAVTGWEVVDR